MRISQYRQADDTIDSGRTRTTNAREGAGGRPAPVQRASNAATRASVTTRRSAARAKRQVDLKNPNLVGNDKRRKM